MVKQTLLILFSLIFFANAACVRTVPSTTQQAEKKITSYEEDLSTVRPKYEQEQVKKNELEKAENTKEVLSFTGEEPLNDNMAINMVLGQIKEKNKSLTDAQGFRISIFSGNNRSSFEAAKSYIFQNHPELEIYESYSQPTYKIKVGDFMNRMDAERYYASLVNRFPTAKIMMDKIDVKRSLNIKQ